MTDSLATKRVISSFAQNAIVALVLVAVLLFAWFVHSPAYPGIFLLDDFPNLEPLHKFIADPGWSSALDFILGNTSGPLGRPVSLASFLVEANDWPNSAEPFLRSNILIHLCNGLLAFLICRRLALLHGLPSFRSSCLATVIAAIWLVHPANTATTLYIIQRMTLLSSFFMLVGFLLYVAGRPLLREQPHSRLGSGLLGAALLVGVGLGTASKENAVSVILIMLSAEWTIFRDYGHGVAVRIWRTVLVTPVVALIVYIAGNWPGHAATYEVRGFNVYERLITQPVVLLGYLHNTLVPAAANISIFRDDFQIARSLTERPAVLLALVVHAVALGAALWFSRRRPAFAFCIIGFYAAHLLESSVLPLELYFEHRNYLAGGLVIALVVISAAPFLARHTPRLLAPLSLTIFALFGFVTYTVSMTWSNPELAAVTWTAERPASIRAHQFAVDVWGSSGNLLQAEKVAREGFSRNPRHIVLLLQALQMRCAAGNDVTDYVHESMESTKDLVVDHSTFDTLSRLQALSAERRCTGLGAQEIADLVGAVLNNSRIGIRDRLRSQALFTAALAYRDMGDLRQAIDVLEKSHHYHHDPEVRRWQASWALEAGDPIAAQNYHELAKHEEAAIAKSKLTPASQTSQ